MTLQSSSWETHLLDLAREPQPVSETFLEGQTQSPELKQAYRTCEQVTQSHSRTFYLASALLPASERLAVRALYAFCRSVDDLVDRRAEQAHAGLDQWTLRLSTRDQEVDDAHNRLIALAWDDARHRYRVPRRYAEQLIEGVSRDLAQTRYRTFDELAAYCYGVASTVGLMSMHIVGYCGPQAVPYAVKLGVALQLTNILRDVGEDWQAGRLYLPLEELAEYGLDEQDLARGQVTVRWRKFMRFQIQRARRLYAEALPGIALLAPSGRFAIGAAAELYRAILDDIEAHDHDVFNRRAYTTSWEKLRRLPGIWRRARWG